MRVALTFIVVLAACGRRSTAIAIDASFPNAPRATDAAAPIVSTPVHIAIGDLDADGRPDLVVASYGSNTVSVFHNATAAGAMTPAFAPRVDLVAGGGPHCIAIADLNGDGKLDLAVANINANTVSVFLNTTATGATAPSFASRADFATGVFADAAVAIADFNGDGKPDVAVTNAISNVVCVLLNTTATGALTPTFAATLDLQTGTSPQAIAVADFNGDHKPDVAVVNVGPSDATPTVAVLLDTTVSNATTPTFAAKLDLTTDLVGTIPVKVVVGDFNQDGRPDVAVGNFTYGTLATPDPLSVFLNTTPSGATAPSFTASVGFTTNIGQNPNPAVGDFNGDGKPDLAIANGMVAVLLNTTAANAMTPIFGAEMDFPAGATPLAIAVDDLNGDGRPDLAVANFGSNTISVLLDTTAANATIASFSAKVDFGTDP